MKTVKQTLSLAVPVILVLFLCACGEKSASAWQEQYVLGVRYLSDGNYEEAIIAFTAAIEIDEKRPETYLGLADAYIGVGEIDTAIRVLEDGLAATQDQRLEDRIAELAKAAEVTEEIRPEKEYDENGNLVRRNYYDENGKLEHYQINSTDDLTGYERVDSYLADGTLQNYYLYYDSSDGLRHYSECFTPDEASKRIDVRVMDASGKWLYSGYVDEQGKDVPTSIAQYNGQENIGWDNYSDGVLTGYARFENGKTVYYDANGNVTGYSG